MNFKTRLAMDRLRLYAVPIGLIVVMVLISFYILVPQAINAISIYQALEEKQTQLDILNKKVALLTSLSTEELSKLQDAEQALPSEKDATSIIIGLETISSQTQSIIEQLNLTPGVVSTGSAQGATASQDQELRNGAYTLAVKTNWRGSTDQFMNTLQTLYNARRLFDISKVTANFAGADPNIIEFSLDIFSYYLPPITQITDLDTALPQITAEEQVLLSALPAMPYVSNLFAGGAQTETNFSGGRNSLFQ